MIRNMNDDIPSFDDPAREREWLAQENAMRRERLHLDPHSDDARAQRYRMLARALRQPPEEGLPPDFARQVAARAGSVPRTSYGTRFEFGLIIVLSLALLIGSVVVSVQYGSGWLRPMIAPSLSATPSLHLLLALAGCVGFTWLLGRWQQAAGRR
ncbi:MAG TPA: hypothetical protein VGC19_14525 [Rhodanobacter sp.]